VISARGALETAHPALSYLIGNCVPIQRLLTAIPYKTSHKFAPHRYSLIQSAYRCRTRILMANYLLLAFFAEQVNQRRNLLIAAKKGFLRFFFLGFVFDTIEIAEKAMPSWRPHFDICTCLVFTLTRNVFCLRSSSEA
jgi:hypothetical protein